MHNTAILEPTVGDEAARPWVGRARGSWQRRERSQAIAKPGARNRMRSTGCCGPRSNRTRDFSRAATCFSDAKNDPLQNLRSDAHGRRLRDGARL